MKKKSTQSNYVQTVEDEAFIEAVEYIMQNKKFYRLKTRKTLTDKIGMFQTHYIAIRNGERGISKDKLDYIIAFLKNNYNISEQFLRFKTGPISLIPVSELDKKTINLKQALKTIDDLQAENKGLNEKIAEKNEMIKLLKSSNNALKQLLDMGKNVGKLTN